MFLFVFGNVVVVTAMAKAKVEATRNLWAGEGTRVGKSWEMVADIMDKCSTRYRKGSWGFLRKTGLPNRLILKRQLSLFDTWI